MTAYEPRCFCCKKPLTMVRGTTPSPTPETPDRVVETESMECTDADCIAWRERAKKMSQQIPNPPMSK